jgi:hypothetical protein
MSDIDDLLLNSNNHRADEKMRPTAYRPAAVNPVSGVGGNTGCPENYSVT